MGNIVSKLEDYYHRKLTAWCVYDCVIHYNFYENNIDDLVIIMHVFASYLYINISKDIHKNVNVNSPNLRLFCKTTIVWVVFFQNEKRK